MKLLVLDCDGVLSTGEAQPFDLSLFAKLAALNRRARRGEAAPAVTLNTGRPSPYIEAVMQAIEGWQPALYENGAGLYSPAGYRFQTTPLLRDDDLAQLQRIKRQIDRRLVQPGRAYWQPGKTVCLSLFARSPGQIADFTAEVAALVQEVSPQFLVTPAKLALNIHPAGVNKGSGLRWLAEVTGIEPADMAGVGDTTGDLEFLRLVGQSAAPANATADVQAEVDYVAAQPDAAGVQEILGHWFDPAALHD